MSLYFYYYFCINSKNARVGTGSLVIEDVKDKTTVFGNPAKSID